MQGGRETTKQGNGDARNLREHMRDTIIRRIGVLVEIALLFGGGVGVAIAHAARGKASQVATASAATVDDFAWMAGRWVGKAGNASIENVCSTPSKGQMMCMFRAADD